MERRAALISFLLVVVNTGLWMALLLFVHLKWVLRLNLALLALGAIFVVVSLVKFFPAANQRDLSAVLPFDERDHMFSRNNLKSHPRLAALCQYLEQKRDG